jgi:hypothetical protein
MGEISSESNNDFSPVFARLQLCDHWVVDLEETRKSATIDDCGGPIGGGIVSAWQHGCLEPSTVSKGP